MPFIKKERRELINDGKPMDWDCGDLCYVFYKNMVDTWRACSRWKTVHEIYRDIICAQSVWETPEETIAKRLAWQVFFNLYVMEYEKKKREENGDI